MRPSGSKLDLCAGYCGKVRESDVLAQGKGRSFGKLSELETWIAAIRAWKEIDD